MKNLVINVLAIDESYQTSSQLAEKNRDKIAECYLKDAFVCLKSCIINTADTDGVLFVNFDVNPQYKKIYEDAGIMIIKIPFDKFRYPSKFSWAIVNFRLCCLEYAANNMEYDNFLALDTDVYCVDSLTDMFSEMKYGMMMHNIGHRLSHKDRQEVIDTTPYYFGERVDIVHYGGECVGGTKDNLKKFIKLVEDVYNKTYKAVTANEINKFNDEYIMSMAAHCMEVRAAVPYIFRYWTIKDFYLVCTNWKYNSVCLWHLPVEKKRGMYKLYNYYMKKHRFPTVDRAAKMMGFGRTTRPFVLSDYPIRLSNFIGRTFLK